jgi:hypothetical protein
MMRLLPKMQAKSLAKKKKLPSNQSKAPTDLLRMLRGLRGVNVLTASGLRTPLTARTARVEATQQPWLPRGSGTLPARSLSASSVAPSEVRDIEGPESRPSTPLAAPTSIDALSPPGEKLDKVGGKIGLRGRGGDGGGCAGRGERVGAYLF